MPALAKPLYTTYQADAPREFRDFTAAIQAASTHEERLSLLAEKQLLHPPRRSPERFEEVRGRCDRGGPGPQKPDIYTTRNGENWHKILQKKQRMDRARRGDCVSVSDIKVTL